MKQKSKWLLLCLTLLFCAAITSAQEREVSGTVKDAIGNPLPDASYIIRGTKSGGITDAAGHFSVTVKGPQTILVFTLVDYTPQEVRVGQNTSLDVVMQLQAGKLGEVVITTYGIKKQNKNLGYSTTTVAGEELAQTNTVSPITALQGKVAGVLVNVVSASGVQTSPYIQIRGASVLGGNNQPIFVVDGNILQNNISGPDATDNGSQLKNLNPDDYESITVLKGAAATALYGSRGLNGAVVITTKSGKAGKGLGIDVSSTYQRTHVYRSFMDLQNEYGMGSYNREGAFAPDGTQSYTNSNWGPMFDGTMHPTTYGVNGDSTMVPYVAQPDNWKAFYQDGNYVNNNIALSGGSDKATYRFAYSNTGDKGILPNNSLSRNAFDIKVSGSLNKIFSAEMGINYANTVSKNFYNQSRYSWPGGGNLGFNAYYMPRNTDFAAWHDSYRNDDNSIKQSNFSFVTNGFANLDKNNFSKTENSLLGYVLLKAQVNPWLDFSGRGNINYYTQFNETKNFGNQQFNAGGQYAVGGSYTDNYNLLFMAHAVRKVMNDDLHIDMRILNEYYGNLLGQNYYQSTDGGLKVPNQFFLGNSVNIPTYQTNGSGTINYGIGYPSSFTIGLAGILNLNYKDYLNLELTGRNDWLSALTYPVGVPGTNHNSVFYPSANLAYSFYDQFEKSMPSWLSSGRLRASLAYTGSAGLAAPYSTGAGYAPGITVNGTGNSIPSATQINGNIKPNYDLQPQIQRALEFGTNLSFIHHLISVDLTWYKTNTLHQLLNITGVQETGYNKLYFNAGNIQNQGYEVLVDVNPVRTKDWNLDLSVNLAHNAGKIVDFYPGITNWNITPDYEGAQVWAYQGGQFGELEVRGNTAFQIDRKTGYPIIENAPRSTNSNPNNYVDFANYQYAYDTAQLVNTGKVEPQLMGGFLINLRYKGFSLFSQIDARFGGMVYSESYTYAMGTGTPLSSLQYRDQAHGGVARTDSYSGKTVYNGAVPNAVFGPGQFGNTTGNTAVDISGMTFQQAYSKGLVESWYAPAYYDGGYGYNGTYDFENGLNYNGAITKESWIMLREITLGYQVPASWLSKKQHVFKGAKLLVSAHNIGYLYNSLPNHQNPASLSSNDPFSPFITGGVPFARDYSATLSLRF